MQRLKIFSKKTPPFREFCAKKRQRENKIGAVSDCACPTNFRHLEMMFSDLLADKIVHLARPFFGLSKSQSSEKVIFKNSQK